MKYTLNKRDVKNLEFLDMHEPIAPIEIRELIRIGKWRMPTTGTAPGYVQANLVMLPKEDAFYFMLFCIRNPKPCPILEVLEPGQFKSQIAKESDIRTDIPKYRIYEQGKLKEERESIVDIFNKDMVGFLLGCSFSFERALLASGIPVRNIDEKKNVSMYITNKNCIPAGQFSSALVVSMRPMSPEQGIKAIQITSRFHLAHGAPVHMGFPEDIGIKDLSKPDFGDPVNIFPGEIPVFWACGVTAITAVTSARLPLVITHAPGHMFVSDLKDDSLSMF